MTTYFTSDLHFGHKRICELANRPFANHLIMQDRFIEEWNDTVAAGDTIYHLGDFSFFNAQLTADIASALKGSIHFLRGNHDEALAKAFRGGLLGARGGPQRFFHEYKELTLEGQKVVLFHFPIAVWNGAHKGAWHLHGHSHGNFHYDEAFAHAQLQPAMDVGYDATGLLLTPWSEIVATLSTRSYSAADHHGGLD